MQIYEENEGKESGGAVVLDWESLIDDFWKGLRRFWMIFIMVILLSVNICYIISVRNYQPSYYHERIYSISRANQSVDGLGVVMARRLAASFTETLEYSGLKQELLSYITPVQDTIPAEITLQNVNDTDFLTIRVTADNYYNSERIMQLFCGIYPEYANNIVGNVRMSLISETDSGTEKNGIFATKTFAEGAGIGVLLCVLWLCYYALSRKTIRKEENMHSLTSLECLMGIPEVHLKKRSSKANHKILITNRIVDESFKADISRLRRHVRQMMQNNESKVLLVTSSVAREGKTMIASNLALSLAEAGCKVVLVEANLRNSTNYLLNSDGPGLIDYAAGKADIDQILKREADNLALITPGTASLKHNYSELLASKKIQDLIRRLRTSVDFVILDTAPLATVADTSVLLAQADEVLYIVRQDYVYKRDVEEGLEMLTKSGKQALGFVMNYAQSSITDNSKYGYGKYGYGKYGYGKYGYGKYGYGSKSGGRHKIEVNTKEDKREDEGQ